MTIEERLDRIEHTTAGLGEERRKDREEYKTLWRDAQRQITRLAEAQVRTEQAIAELAVETRFRIQEIADDSRAADQRLPARIESLVSAIGQLIPPIQP